MEPQEAELSRWIGLLRTVDQLLAGPTRTLVQLMDLAQRPPRSNRVRPRTVPSWIAAGGAAERPSLLVHAICGSAVQRLSRTRRRFPWLDRDTAAAMDRVIAALPQSIAPPSDGSSREPKKTKARRTPLEISFAKALDDEIFGAMNPLTSAEVFRVLIRAGEREAHGRLGFLALFGMLWALVRDHGEGAADGAALDPWRPTAYVTAKCLMPLDSLIQIITRRAAWCNEIAAVLDDLQGYAGDGNDAYKRWRFALDLDRLSRILADVAELSVAPEAFRTCSDAMQRIAVGRRQSMPIDDQWPAVRAALDTVLKTVADAADGVLVETEDVVKLAEDIAAMLRDETRRDEFRSVFKQFPQGTDDYWNGHAEAARRAAAICRECLAVLREVVDAARANEEPAARFRSIARHNRTLAAKLRHHVRGNAAWCRRVVRQEIAYASAANETEFDPAELLSGLATAERWEQMSDLEIEDAIRRSTSGARQDGSWSTGQPIYMIKRALGVWPFTVDIVFLLTTALSFRPAIRAADAQIEKFVLWLDRTRTTFSATFAGADIDVAGWSSETRETDTIDTWTSATAVSALLDIRDLAEHRLWELCERYLFVKRDLKPLSDIDPVDLGAEHSQRVHHRLMKMARDTRGPEWKEAQYSLIFHGPPGSSKTVLGQALAVEMWSDKRERRFVRVTPGDFTRRGEDGVDAEARFIFTLLANIRGATIFFDEIDDLLRRRTGETSFLKLVTPAMLNRLQDLRDAAPRQEICFLLGTNYIANIEPALTRKGRIDASIPIPYPDRASRAATLARHLQQRPFTFAYRVLDDTDGWPWTTFDALCRWIAGARPGLIVQQVDEMLDKMRDDFESLDTYYGDPDKWRNYSADFVNEAVHCAFAFGSSQADAQAKIEKLKEFVPQATRNALDRQLKAQWRGRG